MRQWRKVKETLEEDMGHSPAGHFRAHRKVDGRPATAAGREGDP